MTVINKRGKSEMREKALNWLAKVSAKHPVIIVAFTLIITIIAAGLSENLKLEMQFKNLMPQDHKMVQEFNNIVDNFSTATMIIVAAKGDENELKMFADELAPKLRAMKKYVQRVDYRIEKDFYLKHGLMLQKEKDLKNSIDIYTDLSLLPFVKHLNDNFEKTYVYDDESISTKEKENNAVKFLDGIKSFLFSLENYTVNGNKLSKEAARKTVDEFLIGDEYMISQDKNMILMFARPTFSLNEVDKVILAENEIDSLIFSVAEKYPSIFAGTTGTMALSRDETMAASEDMYITSILAFAIIIALFIISFRMWVAPVLAGIVLIIGIMWSMGFTAITLGSLNIMTSMFAVILMGLGIDFSIHIITVYTESRAEGKSINEAIKNTLNKSGKGIITGGITTAMAFLTLIVSETDGMKEFGIVAGTGVLFCLLVTILVLPSLLAIRDKILMKIRKEKFRAKSTEFVYLGRITEKIGNRPILYLVVMGVITIGFLIAATQITFDYNYLNMEPEGLTSIKLQDDMEDKFDVTPDFSLMTTNSVEESREISEQAKDLKIVGMVTGISDYVPSLQEQKDRTTYLNKIRNSLENNTKISKLTSHEYDLFIDQLNRLDDNIIEMAQLSFMGGQDKVDRKCKELIGNIEEEDNKTLIEKITRVMNHDRNKTVENLNFFAEQYAPYFRDKALNMASTEPITMQSLPENIVDQFSNADRTKFLVTVYPKEGVWKDLEFLERFTNQMSNINERMTGMPSIFYVLIGEIAEDGEVAFLLTTVVIFLLLLWDFRKFRYAIFAMIPLVIGAIWMVGIMCLSGIELTMVNVMGLPLILGIGIDDGVHILHRYQIEGRNKIKTIFQSTGKAVLLTSLTTMMAFGSLFFATYRGLGSLGITLFIGVGTCFLTTIFIMPAIIALIDKKVIVK